MPVLADPLRNRGTAFTQEQRAQLRIEGLLPPRVESLAEQASRVLANLRSTSTALDRYQQLAALQGDNETLFHRVLLDNLDELLPVVYTPTVGQACLEWSRIYARPRGLYLTLEHRGRIDGVLRNWPQREVRMIVATDGGRILGLGDLGANGMGIPIGKLVLYTACAGLRPELCLPVTLDAGTDNEALRNDPWYVGTRRARITGDDWDAFVDEFVDACRATFPGAILQFEDFNNATAFSLLERHRERLCCFNDDIQGTGAMGLAGLLAAGRITGKRLVEQRILFAGAGEACLGIGGLVVAAMQREGLTEAEAKHRCLFADSKGLVVASRSDLAPHKRRYAQERAPATDLRAAIESFAPSVLVGASGTPGLFTPPLLQAMARVNERPIVFALSNPTSKSECTAEQAYRYTEGRAVFASGSPFAPVTVGARVIAPGQANNSYVFPGVGLGLLLSGAKRVTDTMFLAAAQALAGEVSLADLEAGRVFPKSARMREVAATVAAAVSAVAFDEQRLDAPRPDDLKLAARLAMYQPAYPS
ncbi:MAG: NAD-dependent malic enzyme [Betaproteobacteria bacterium]